MKRPWSRPDRHQGSNRSADNVISSSTDLDSQFDATYETDLTEPDDALSTQKRLRLVESHHTPESEGYNDAAELYDDPLDDTGIDLSEIPEDFDKAEGTIIRRERIETRWKRSVNLAEIYLSRPLLTKS